MKLYEFNQNNSGGYFVTNENLCHRVFIEADNVREAIEKAEQLGCYWDGVNKGIDCSCCGDRWRKWIGDDDYKNIERINEDYSGKIIFKNTEEYIQFLADEYGWTKPDARIFYKDGTTKEIYRKKDLDNSNIT
jgi:hypothetical protein